MKLTAWIISTSTNQNSRVSISMPLGTQSANKSIKAMIYSRVITLISPTLKLTAIWPQRSNSSLTLDMSHSSWCSSMAPKSRDKQDLTSIFSSLNLRKSPISILIRPTISAILVSNGRDSTMPSTDSRRMVNTTETLWEWWQIHKLIHIEAQEHSSIDLFKTIHF